MKFAFKKGTTSDNCSNSLLSFFWHKMCVHEAVVQYSFPAALSRLKEEEQTCTCFHGHKALLRKFYNLSVINRFYLNRWMNQIMEPLHNSSSAICEHSHWCIERNVIILNKIYNTIVFIYYCNTISTAYSCYHIITKMVEN